MDSDKAHAMVDALRAALPSLGGKAVGGMAVENADEFSYLDPVDGSTSAGQGIRIAFAGGARAVFRLSGTGTQGATIRIYLEQLETDPDRLHLEPETVLAQVRSAALALSDLTAMTGRVDPDVVT